MLWRRIFLNFHKNIQTKFSWCMFSLTAKMLFIIVIIHFDTSSIVSGDLYCVAAGLWWVEDVRASQYTLYDSRWHADIKDSQGKVSLPPCLFMCCLAQWATPLCKNESVDQLLRQFFCFCFCFLEGTRTLFCSAWGVDRDVCTFVCWSRRKGNATTQLPPCWSSLSCIQLKINLKANIFFFYFFQAVTWPQWSGVCLWRADRHKIGTIGEKCCTCM